MFRGVTGSMPHGHKGIAESKGIAIVQLLGFKTVLRVRFMAYIDLRGVDTRTQFARTANQVGVNVRLENVRDGDVFFPGELDVFLYIRSGIEDRRDPFVVIPDQVRKLGDSFGLDAFKDE